MSDQVVLNEWTYVTDRHMTKTMHELLFGNSAIQKLHTNNSASVQAHDHKW